MKTLIQIFFIFIFSICRGQKGADYWAKIPEKIQNEKEIRIYKDYSITNGGKVFLIYLQDNKWNAELIDWNFPSEFGTHEFQTIEPRITKLKADEINFMNFEIRNIEFLPNENTFQYKKEKREIVYDEDLKENVISTSKMMVMDGVSYRVIYKNGKLQNSFNYSNPKSYLKDFPEINELKSFFEILNYIETEFKIKF
ncbi:hypothetical protein [Chryseobacterium salivictor]|uniref:Uncharacterized protein n=1 Tax=Chryseobacterium salivictor TaxID=2547600 RepID=A0A4P6ZEK5_9FLAO|nr:hypothetical protein [Chryseobacterium salivictor]QBO58003.1 hypothetical protein NBC122_01176 [Chryseobacterium salivictor]